MFYHIVMSHLVGLNHFDILLLLREELVIASWCHEWQLILEYLTDLILCEYTNTWRLHFPMSVTMQLTSIHYSLVLYCVSGPISCSTHSCTFSSWPLYCMTMAFQYCSLHHEHHSSTILATNPFQKSEIRN